MIPQVSDLKAMINQMEAAYRENKGRMRLVIEHAPVAIAVLDHELRYLAASRRWRLDFGLNERSIIGLGHYDLCPNTPEHWQDAFRRSLQGEVVTAREDRFVRAKDGIRWICWEVRPWQLATGAIGGILVFYEDITDYQKAQTALHISEEHIGAILLTAVDAIVTINHRGIMQSVNPATERLFGYTAADLLGKNVSMLMPSPFREEHDNYINRYLSTRQARIIGVGREVLGRHKNGETFPVELAVSELDHLKLFTGIIRDIRQRKELERDIVEIASMEQHRIGQDLHDTVGQELTALNILAGDLGDALKTDSSSAPSLIERLVKGLQRAQRELRIVLRGLLPVPVDREGLMAALTDLAHRTNEESKVRCTFLCDHAICFTDTLTATHLYLIAQEAVHNALKHSKAENIRISLVSNSQLFLSVRDDGIGMTTKSASHMGLGLRIMQNRAAIIGATLTFVNSPPTGTLVTCALRRNNHEQHQDQQES